MIHVTRDIQKMRRWAEARGGRPCRDASGRLSFTFAEGRHLFGHRHHEAPHGQELSWEDFDSGFCEGGCVFVFDDARRDHHFFIGTEDEARHWVEHVVAGGEVENTLGP